MAKPMQDIYLESAGPSGINLDDFEEDKMGLLDENLSMDKNDVLDGDDEDDSGMDDDDNLGGPSGYGHPGGGVDPL